MCHTAGWILVQNLLCIYGLTALSLQTYKFQPYSLSAGGARFEFAQHLRSSYFLKVESRRVEHRDELLVAVTI